MLNYEPRRADKEWTKTLINQAESGNGPDGRLRGLRAEFVLLNLNRSASPFEADHASPRYQLERGLIIQLGWPAYRQLHTAARQQHMFDGEQHTGTGDVDSFAVPHLFTAAFVQDSVPHFTLNRKTIRMAAIGLRVVV
jgi:hypothetical protein